MNGRTCLVVVLLTFSVTATAYDKSQNPLAIYQKRDGKFVEFADGSGKINIGCMDEICGYIPGKYTHPSGVQQHGKSYVKLNADGTGSYALWDYSGGNEVCSGSITKWGLIYKEQSLISPNILFVASRDASDNPECEFSHEAKVYEDFVASPKAVSFKYFVKE